MSFTDPIGGEVELTHKQNGVYHFSTKLPGLHVLAVKVWEKEGVVFDRNIYM